MENIERLTDKITFLEKEKKAVGQEEKETPAEEKKPDTLISILMEWQQNRSSFIQGNNIRQRTDTKAGNVKDFSVMVAFLQSHKIETLEDLRKLAEDTKKRRSDNIHNQREFICIHGLQWTYLRKPPCHDGILEGRGQETGKTGKGR